MTKFRGAIEYERQPNTEHSDIDALIGNFRKLNKMFIAVSFVHMAFTMMAFTYGLVGLPWLIVAAATLVMVLGIDLALMWLSAYIGIQLKHKQPIGFWNWLSFIIALVVEVAFNTASLILHMPPAMGFFGYLIAGTFGSFVALIIYTSATAPNRLRRTLEYIAHLEKVEAENERKRLEVERKQQRQQAMHERFEALQSHNETSAMLPAPDDDAAIRTSNGKSAISADDIHAILKVLYDKQVMEFKTKQDLRRLLGFASTSSGTKAYETLQRNNMVEVSESGYAIIWENANAIA